MIHLVAGELEHRLAKIELKSVVVGDENTGHRQTLS